MASRDRLRVDGMADLNDGMSALTGVLREHVVGDLKKLGEAIEDLADQFVPVRTGALKRSGIIEIYNDAVVVRFGGKLAYAIPVHENRAHRGAKFLEGPAVLLGGHWKAKRLDSAKGKKATKSGERPVRTADGIGENHGNRGRTNCRRGRARPVGRRDAVRQRVQQGHRRPYGHSGQVETSNVSGAQGHVMVDAGVLGSPARRAGISRRCRGRSGTRVRPGSRGVRPPLPRRDQSEDHA